MYWGEPTASIDWCEENYANSYYIAEWYNSWSSLFFCVMGLTGLYLNVKQQSLKTAWLGSILLIVVGLGSFAFHATLLYSSQMADELPMSWAALSWCYIQVERGPKERFPMLPRLLWLYSLITTAWQIALTHSFPILLEVQFGLMFVYIMYINYRHYYCKLQPGDPHFLFWLYAITALVAFFGCWIPDQVFCYYWRSSAWFNPQLHAHWHVLMAISSHCGMTLTLFFRAKMFNRAPEIRYLFGVLPYCHQRPSPPDKR